MMIRPGKRFPRMGFGQPLGLLGLVSILRQRFPDMFVVDLVEQALRDLSAGEVRARMAAFGPDLVCFSCLSVEANELRELAAISKEMFPDVPVWLGGPHSTVFYDVELEAGHVDAACIGEGDHTFPEMIEAWLAGRPLDSVPGLALLRGGEVVLTAPRPPVADLDTLPLPAWDLVDFDLYSRQHSLHAYVHSTPWACFFTSRGCPYDCIYCHSIFGKKMRVRSVSHVMDELELLVREHGVREIHIVDDSFNVDLPRAKAICDEIVARGLDIKIAFPNGIRGDRMDRELVRKLRAAGCYAITYAVETASPRMQKKIRKNLDLARVEQSITWAREEGIIPQAFAMLGFPGETLEEIQQTIDYMLRTDLLQCVFASVVVFPRTRILEIAKQEYPGFALEEHDFSSYYYFAADTFYGRVTGVDLHAIQRRAYRAFYLRPSIILKLLVKLPKNRSLFMGMLYGVRAVLAQLGRRRRGAATRPCPR